MTGEASSASPVAEPMITVGLHTYVITTAGGFTFGRDPASTHCLDRDDLGVSRSAGAVVFHGQHWWIINSSKTNSLTIEEFGLRETLMAGRSRLLAESTTIWVAGRFRSYALHVELPENGSDGPPVRLDAGTAGDAAAGLATWSAPELTARERAAREPLFEPLFRTDGHSDPIPATYSAVAPRLGLPEASARRRVETLRARLTHMGLVNVSRRGRLR
ncbi:FHA domain-containing protein [Frankia sp. AiPs1]|uniref:hypothetical protein n=1 Tax=Frankia sp. AiPa1 TaxID=573492 RepID=UPI00202B5DA8|nr:hypothetical protein [Frankia sp. AiPa1]MCL9758618.1 hypothetical protein [Frankia sp. AiPa1]